MVTHFSFPSIEQFRHTVKTVEARSKYHEMKVRPVIKFSGTVKLHGTNAAVALDTKTGEMWAQSRERILSLEQDNAGFCQWFETNLFKFPQIFDSIVDPHEFRYVVIYGEWCGGNIQSGVAISGLDKMFVVFKVRLTNDLEEDSSKWINDIPDFSNIRKIEYLTNIYSISEFSTFEIEVDFNNPELSQNALVELTEAVEAECPVGKSFGNSGIGEGIVWTAVSSDIEDFNLSGLMFKVKGERHSSSKVRTLAAVDVELIKKMDELVDYVLTDNRLNQGLDVLKANGINVDDNKNTKEFIDWIRKDVFKEERDTILKSGLDFGKVMGKICSKAGKFFATR